MKAQTVSYAGVAWQKSYDAWGAAATKRQKAEQAALEALAWKENKSAAWNERVKACERVVKTTRHGAETWAEELKALEDMLEKTRDMVRAWVVDAEDGANCLAKMKTPAHFNN